jgi:hypothetical protein
MTFRCKPLRSLAGGPFGSSLGLLGTASLRFTFRVKARLRPPCCGNFAAFGDDRTPLPWKTLAAATVALRVCARRPGEGVPAEQPQEGGEVR